MNVHKFDSLSFLAGLVITTIGLGFLVLAEINDIIDALSNAGSWFWPVVLVAIGVAVLAPLATRSTDHDAIEQSEDEEI